jgi:hypothetical protein
MIESRFPGCPLIAAATLLPVQALYATEFSKEVAPLALETHAPARPASPSTQSRQLLSLSASPSWSVHPGGNGGSLCNEEAALLPANDTTMRAIALAAIASGQRLYVVVDDTRPKIGNVCEITLLTIKSS